jgi:hypothetical protein
MRNLEVLPDLAGWNRTEVLLQVLRASPRKYVSECHVFLEIL